jgi:beta-lactamase class A
LDLSDLEARHGGRLGINAKSGTSVVTWRSQERFPYCSTFKVFLAACVMQRVQSELEKLNREVPITEADLVPHAPVTGRALGSTLTINALLKAAVEVSDNSATNILLREIGAAVTIGFEIDARRKIASSRISVRASRSA